ncbi:FeoB-associated Cys-rich membrane protein [Pseudoflavonifractor sp. An184]|uniref:FeoB-associated Cys-rich membrane protein n=1 Tax=Pseudoflavonifractor sp. An184 TaxID=1965576 RepID=UPI00112183A9|nr:FeoB-associated Cys-rich membrane protein [Pseudoflavonifractor sp. An184]HIW27882.1 FeoB-associated Cys-rich membrane protein [Candidatus Lawsonibacter pullicola]
MTDLIVAAIVLAIIGGILFYLYRAKKRGETCIGCPYAKQCGSGACGGHRVKHQ